MKQKTLKDAIEIKGSGIHTNLDVNLKLVPAPENTGIIFRRVDQSPAIDIKACIENIKLDSSNRQSTLSAEGVSVKTVEHLLAPLYGCGVSNLYIEIDQEELPALDGGAQQYIDAIEKVGVIEQDGEQLEFAVTEPVHFNDEASQISMVALPAKDFRISYTLSYGSEDLHDQFLDIVLTEDSFKNELAGARTFCLKKEAELLQEAGYGKGANFSNTLVFEKNLPLENELRFHDEAVRHKVVDMIGDLSLLGARYKMHVVAFKSGHSQNLGFVKKIKEQYNRVKGNQSKGVIGDGMSDTFDKVELDINDIQKILPHRYPFLFVDKVLHLEVGKRATAIKNLTMNEEFFQGHFPGHPVMPGVIIVEAMAQVAGIIMLNDPDEIGKIAYFMSIDNAKFRHPVKPGDQLRFEVEVLKRRSRYGSCAGKAYVGDTLAREAELKFSFLEK